MFNSEQENTNNKPEFEAGFNQSQDIIVNIKKQINSTNINVLIATIDEWVDKFYSMRSKETGCKVICIFDTYGTDYSCVTSFSNYIESLTEKRPKVVFAGVLEYAEGAPALMYMLMTDRVVQTDQTAQTNSGMAKMGQSVIKFLHVPTNTKNEMAKIVIKKIKKELLPLCFPANVESEIQICGELVYNDGYGTILQ